MARFAGPYGFLAEIKRRRVFRVAAVYIVGSWLLVQIAATVFPALHLPEWTITLVVVLAILGFPLAVMLAWAFDITPGGVERTSAAGESDETAPEPKAVAGAAASTFTDSLARGTRTSRPGTTHLRPSPSEDAGHTRGHPSADSAETTEPHPTSLPDPERVRRASLAHVRHELRTPINAILGYTEMLVEDLEEGGDETRADLVKILGAGRQLLSQVDAALHPELFIRTSADPDWEEFAARLRFELREPLNVVVGYAEMLLEGNRGADAGLPAADLERILAAARQLASRIDDIVALAAAGAQAGLTSAEFARTTALAEAVLSRVAPRAGPEEIDSGAATLLVVDDNSTNRDLLSRQLARQGYSVFTAANGLEALEMLPQREFDLVLLDVMMPEMDGVETLRRIKADPRSSELPIIMVSALDEIDSVLRCIQLGAADYLTKPFEPALLQARIGASLEVRRMRENERRLAGRLRQEIEFADWALSGLVEGSIVDRIRAGTPVPPKLLSDAVVLSAELDGFQRLASRDVDPKALSVLATAIDEFDRLTIERGLHPLASAGPEYVVIADSDISNAETADAIGSLALSLMVAAGRLEEQAGEQLRLRIGIHSGPLVVGLLPSERPVYGAWGETVETASRLRRTSGPGGIQVSAAFHARVRDSFRFGKPGVIEVPGGGQMKTYLLQGFLAETPAITT